MTDNNTGVFKMFVVEDRLDGDNYPMWAYMMQHFLMSKGIWNIVKGIDVRFGSEDVDEVEDVVGLAARIAIVRFVLPTAKQARWDRPPTEPANKKRKKRSQRKSESSEGDEDVEDDPDDKEENDVLDIDSPPIGNLNREDEPLGDLSDPLLGINIAVELWDHVADHKGVEPDPQPLFVLADLRQLKREIGDAQCSGLGSIHRFLGSLTCMGVMDAQAAFGGVRLCIYKFSTNTQLDTGVGNVPSWNMFVDDLAEATFTMEYEFLVVGGVFIALCMPEQYIPILQEAQNGGFQLIRMMYLHMYVPMFIFRKEYIEPVSYLAYFLYVFSYLLMFLLGDVYANIVWWFQMQTLLIAMFVHGRDIGLVQWRYNCAVGQEVAFDDGFGERVDMLWEPSTSDAFKHWRAYHNDKPICLDIKKSTEFASR
ncbi:hypothetical protein L7F22_055351 [Adiantum nelumboides]|nr:hypothetical protein [Adiantum nelumboides]